MSEGRPFFPLQVRPLGHAFGSTRFGTDLAAPPKPDCTCHPYWQTRDVADGACPQHGIHAIVRELEQREAIA